ncbi:hypothetical protein ACXX82_24275 [Glaciimonas sp. GNP009]
MDKQADELKRRINSYLKDSDFLNDVINTHRLGTQRIILALINALTKQDPDNLKIIKTALDAADVNSTSPSIDSEVRRMTRSIRGEIQP